MSTGNRIQIRGRHIRIAYGRGPEPRNVNILVALIAAIAVVLAAAIGGYFALKAAEVEAKKKPPVYHRPRGRGKDDHRGKDRECGGTVKVGFEGPNLDDDCDPEG